MLKLFKISGDSLYPLYKDKESVLCLKIYKFIKIKKDDTVIFEKNTYGMMIKIIKYIDDKYYFVEGTNPMSIDSRNFGMLTREEIKYKVLFKI